MRQLAILLLCLVGCAQVEPPLERVTAVVVQYSDETGKPDFYTVVEFPDGTRRKRWDVYATPGDTFYAKKTDCESWR